MVTTEDVRAFRTRVVVLLVLAAVVGAGAAWIAFLYAVEYGDPGGPARPGVQKALTFFGVGALFAALLALRAWKAAGRHPRVLAVGGAITVLALVGIGLAGHLGVDERERRDAAFATCGEAVFTQLDQIKLPGDVQAEAREEQRCSYRITSAPADIVPQVAEAVRMVGWTVEAETGQDVRATRPGFTFALVRAGDAWTATVATR